MWHWPHSRRHWHGAHGFARIDREGRFDADVLDPERDQT
ncbi:hypothetical protein Z949_590 [Sulfitobacter guttiformis KCTC 32187]|nr:hypothetical protein Z949_590 [Sulfitobacter guttiformis KCTC 32187]